jgi:hypothetical protein
MGRPKGAKNIRSFNAEELAKSMDVDPLEILLWVSEGNWEKLGFKEKTKTTFTAQGIEVEEDNVPLKERVQASKEAAKYLHAAKQSIALSTGAEGLKIVVEDYLKE